MIRENIYCAVIRRKLLWDKVKETSYSLALVLSGRPPPSQLSHSHIKLPAENVSCTCKPSQTGSTSVFSFLEMLRLGTGSRRMFTTFPLPKALKTPSLGVLQGAFESFLHFYDSNYFSIMLTK